MSPGSSRRLGSGQQEERELKDASDPVPRGPMLGQL